MKERAVLCRLKGRRDMVGLDVAFGGGPGGGAKPAFAWVRISL